MRRSHADVYSGIICGLTHVDQPTEVLLLGLYGIHKSCSTNTSLPSFYTDHDYDITHSASIITFTESFKSWLIMVRAKNAVVPNFPEAGVL